LPEFIIAFVTERCNMKCEHCFFWKEVDAPGATMTPAEWRRIASQVGSPAFVALTGGEPFLREDLDEIASGSRKRRDRSACRSPRTASCRADRDDDPHDSRSRTGVTAGVSISSTVRHGS
jgi:MoaA/NifB/PqqE/SkfB family radical SAM enzyme